MVPHKLSLTDDNASDIQLKDLMHNESILFEVRQPLMPDFPINQQNILDMGKWFLERKAPLRGYVGMNKEETGWIGMASSRNPAQLFSVAPSDCDGTMCGSLPTEVVSQMVILWSEVYAFARARQLVPAGATMSGDLMRFDMQVRDVATTNADPSEVDDVTEGAHTDSMSVKSSFAPDAHKIVSERFKTIENNNNKGLAMLIYLWANVSWSGTELCLNSSRPGGPSLVFKPTGGDIVIMTENAVHGVCNARKLAGATNVAQDGYQRVLLRFTMPYDEPRA